MLTPGYKALGKLQLTDAKKMGRLAGDDTDCSSAPGGRNTDRRNLTHRTEAANSERS